MTLSGVFLAIGVLVVALVIWKGFRSGRRVKAIERRDDWQGPGDSSPGAD